MDMLNQPQPVSDEQLMPVVEGLLFAAGEEGLSLLQIQSVLTTRTRQEIADVVLQLQKQCEGRGIELVQFGGRWKYLAREMVYPYARKLYEQIHLASLSPAAMETLALIAYRQPITRVEIDEIRGVSSDMMIRKLQARNLVETCGNLDAPGRPLLYQVTQEFMDVFGLESLNQLPKVEQLEGQETLFE